MFILSLIRTPPQPHPPAVVFATRSFGKKGGGEDVDNAWRVLYIQLVSGINLNPGPPKYEAELLVTKQQRLFN